MMHVEGYSRPWRLVWSPRTDVWITAADDDSVGLTDGQIAVDDRCALDEQTIFVVTSTDEFRFNGVRFWHEHTVAFMHNKTWTGLCLVSSLE